MLSVSISSARPVAANPPNASRLVTQLSIKNGLLTVDREHSNLEASADFTNRLKIPIERARKILFDDLDQQLAALGKPYYNALSTDEQQKDDEGKLNDDLTSKLRTFSGSWTDYRSRFADWVAQDTANRLPLELAMAPLVNAFAAFANETSLTFDSEDVTLWQAGPGQATFTVVDPIQDWNSAEYAIVLPDAATGGTVSSTAEIKEEALKPLLGRLWRSSEIRTRIEVFYARRGLTPIITLSPSDAATKTISIRESLRIARLIFPVVNGSEDDIDKILYLLLNDKQFRLFRKDRTNILSSLISIPGQPDFRAIDYVTHLQSKPNNEPYVNSRVQQIQQLQLADVGYVFSLQPSLARVQPNGITYVDLIIKKQSSNESAPTGSPEQDVKPAPPTDTAQGVVTAESQERESIVQPSRKAALFASGKPAAPDPVKEAASTKERKNFIGGGFEYRPGQGVKAFGLYQRSKFEFLGNDKFSLKIGGQEKALGAINYNSDFVQFRHLPFRLGFQLTGS
ncbi:MAG TPA: hypothetical protein VN743_14775, partial [Blastocatellia bacterium]|nr:hypothetical protein [Blastocatellia bacterium]